MKTTRNDDVDSLTVAIQGMSSQSPIMGWNKETRPDKKTA